MSHSFDTLSRSAKITFWQNIENKIRVVLHQCENQLPARVVEEVSDYLAHNELGLAWETLGSALLRLGGALPASAQQLMLETGICMDFNQAGTRNYVLWKKIGTL